MPLSLQQIRVLGALIEKEITTPDLYPLSLNSLQAACNQRSSRDPVLDLTEDEVRTALHQLEDAGLAGPARGSLHAPAGRVSKFEHHARTTLQLRRDEIAVLCLLLLRGPQTPGELRARADRLHTFEDLASISATLDRLAAPAAGGTGAGASAPRPLVAILPRQPGSRESRYRHLLGLEIEDAAAAPAAPSHSQVAARTERAGAGAQLEARVAMLEERLALLEQRLEQLAPPPDAPAQPSPASED